MAAFFMLISLTTKYGCSTTVPRKVSRLIWSRQAFRKSKSFWVFTPQKFDPIRNLPLLNCAGSKRQRLPDPLKKKLCRNGNYFWGREYFSFFFNRRRSPAYWRRKG